MRKIRLCQGMLSDGCDGILEWWGSGVDGQERILEMSLVLKKVTLLKHWEELMGRESCTGVVKSDWLYTMELGGDKLKRKFLKGFSYAKEDS